MASFASLNLPGTRQLDRYALRKQNTRLKSGANRDRRNIISICEKQYGKFLSPH
jgi:hypothetical protein